MRYVEPPHLILRKQLIAAAKLTTVAADLGRFLAKTLFFSSGLALTGGELRARIATWSQNIAMCALTEKVIFTDPYMMSDLNHWTEPFLDDYAASIRCDSDLKLAAAYFKNIFLTKTQSLLHGDLHTGSVMAKEGSTFVIDPEFAFYGPMGFDIGAILANLYIAYFSHFARNNKDYSEWVLSQVEILYATFEREFLQCWNNTTTGEIYFHSVFTKEEESKKAQSLYLQSVWRDSLGFTGLKIIRRIIGIAHTEDLESISDLAVRSKAEKKALLFARELVTNAHYNSLEKVGLTSISAINVAARRFYAEEPQGSWPGAN